MSRSFVGQRGRVPLVASLCISVALSACAPAPRHGSMSSLSIAKSADWEACEHEVPREVCARCNPELVESFKAIGDWCPEHDVPESQCLKCNPDLNFSPPEAAPPGADVMTIAREGEDVAELEPHCAPNKMTVFDFYADWCPPCRAVDGHLFERQAETDFAIRKLEVGTWNSPLAQRWLGAVPNLPYLLVYSRDCKRVAEVKVADMAAIDRALAAGIR